ncbi:hypothetical protein AK830_g8744 [Neonectria ditissima]|uniref:Uncharacterized protein n=1 Tax=Neonectria ditissima TaxID=78410 RepID=A0A0P7BBP1_9HYPO|nr:hypothetical protein AK830_g8744 [Neonectria ditissima]
MRFFFCRALAFFVLSCCISLFHPQLGLNCGSKPAGFADVPPGASPPNAGESKSRWLVYAEGFILVVSCFILAQGHFIMRATRERIERVRQTAITMTYSLLKTTTTNTMHGYDSDELQLVIYECLALTTAYPVALLHQMSNKGCEPGVTRYCHDAAATLKYWRECNEYQQSLGFFEPTSSSPNFTRLNSFFEIFSLRVEKLFRNQPRTKVPSMAPQHIVYNIRNHFKNLVDRGNLDERKAPIVRENIDMMALAGRECTVFSYGDVAPVAFMWMLDLSTRLISVTLPAQNCDYIINSTRNVGGRMMFPTFFTLLIIVGVSAASATILTLLDELWQMWDPFAQGMNTFSWTLGIAREIDDMLNEFSEDDETVLIRKHAFVESEEDVFPEEFVDLRAQSDETMPHRDTGGLQVQSV